MTAITSSKSKRDPIERACQLHEAAIGCHADGKTLEAESLFRRALQLLERTEGKDSPDVAAVLNDFAGFYAQQCDYTRAEQLYHRAAGIMETMDGDEDVTRLRLQLWQGLGHIKQWQGSYEDAETLLQRAVNGAEQAFGSHSQEAIEALNKLGMLFKEMGRYTEAGQAYQCALAVVEKTRQPDRQMQANLYHNLGGLEHAARNFRRGEPFARRAVELREQTCGSEHPEVAADLAALAALLDGQKKYGEAEPLYQRALAIFEEKLGAAHPHVPICLDNYAQLLRAMKRLAEARTLEARAKRLRSDLTLLDDDAIAATATINPELARFALISKRRIKAGEELTIDYNFSPKVGRVPCHCGSQKCRGTINRRADLS